MKYMIVITILVSGGLLLQERYRRSHAPKPKPRTVTIENFRKLSVGMPFPEVLSILGERSDEGADNLGYWESWDGETAQIIIRYAGGHVTSKVMIADGSPVTKSYARPSPASSAWARP